MARKIICPVCESERFRTIVIKLPSGKNRITEFEACRRCATVFHRPEETATEHESNISDFASHVPTDVSRQIAKTFPDFNTASVDTQTAHYKHPTFGRLVLLFKRTETKGISEPDIRWHLIEAKRLTG